MADSSQIALLQAENKSLRMELSRLRGQLLKAYKDRAEIHARLRALTSTTWMNPTCEHTADKARESDKSGVF